MGVVYASINVSEASRATVYPGELTFTPDNWADPKVGRPLHTVSTALPPSYQLSATVQPSMPHLPLREKLINYPQVISHISCQEARCNCRRAALEGHQNVAPDQSWS